ncbi:MAG TPA: ABC transporter permease [Thermoanaerobaculia bacterium]|jgi:predicted permease|nr:ABC transporter permease [Thermoanaerobaculia bacterium]
MSFTASLRQDLAWSRRMMRRNWGLTAAVVLSLGLTLGANTATFSVVNAFLLRPLAIEDIDRVVRVREDYAPPGQPADLRSLTAANYGAWRAGQKVFVDIAAATDGNLTWTGAGEPQRFRAPRVSANFFPLLGMRPLLGRSFSAEEDQPGRNQVVILSYDTWTKNFGRDPKTIGRTLTLNGQPYTVMGVMPRGIHHPYEADMWVPLAYRQDLNLDEEYYAPARLKPGVTLAQARTAMNELVRRLGEAGQQQQPGGPGPQAADLSPMRGELVGGLDKLLYLLVAASTLVLLIACVNISNLLLAQGLKQGNEVAVRVALGATRGRLVRQILTYSLVLALLGAALGTLLAALAMKPLVALSPAYALGEFDIEPRLDLVTLGYTLAGGLLVGFLFGMVPALRISRTSLSGALQEGGRARTLGAGGRRLLAGLVIAEVALSLVLLTAAGLLVRSFERIQGEYRGFDMRQVLSFAVPFPDFKFHDAAQKDAFLGKALLALRRIPGVVAVGATSVQPLYTGTNTAAFNVEGKPAAEKRGFHMVHHRIVTPGYLESLRVPLIAGRFLDDHDTAGASRVVVVSKSLADRYWPGTAPGTAIGKQVRRGRANSTQPWLIVVGVAGSLKETHDEVLSNDDAWYVPSAQATVDDLERMTFTVRTEGDPLALVPAVRAAIQSVDKDEPVFDVLTLEERFAKRTTPERFSTVIYTSLGFLGLVLAAIGIYGVLSFTVNQRLREIGIRAAIGAQPAHVRALVLGSGLRLAGAGLLLGVLGALALTRFLASQLYEVSPRDPVALVIAFAGLAVICLVSSYLPARRAAAIDPVSALRTE